ncbi:MAG: RNA polymerase sigma factor [Acidobacteria bacterium]|nr:RNA polymerase sigma factor [Acidobacteriota bacterium]
MAGEVLTPPIEITATGSAPWPAFEELFHIHGTRMKSIAYNLLGNQQDAEDAVQEAFLKSCRSQHNYRGGAALHTWVYRILINVCLDEGRRRQRRPAMDTVVEPRSGDTPADLKFALRHALTQLPRRQRAVFLMAAAEGLPHVEIAAILEISEANSRTLLFDARRQLQGLLSK